MLSTYIADQLTHASGRQQKALRHERKSAALVSHPWRTPDMLHIACVHKAGRSGVGSAWLRNLLLQPPVSDHQAIS